MLHTGVVNRIKENVRKPCFWKSLSRGENWKSKSMRIIPEGFVRDTLGDFDHRVVFSVRWGNSWLLWLEREKKDLFMIEEYWNEFVDDNHLGPNDNLFFRHDDTMFLEVQIFKSNGNEVTDAPLEDEPETEPPHPKPQNSHKETTAAAEFSANGGTKRRGKHDAGVKNPQRYLLNPKNPYFVQAVRTKNLYLYVSLQAITKYGLKFGAPYSVNYVLPGGTKVESSLGFHGGCPFFRGWSDICKKLNLKIGDPVVCEIECSGGLVTAIRVHVVNE